MIHTRGMATTPTDTELAPDSVLVTPEGLVTHTPGSEELDTRMADSEVTHTADSGALAVTHTVRSLSSTEAAVVVAVVVVAPAPAPGGDGW